MKSKGLISAIMPTFNRAHFICDRIRELHSQTYDNWELIIINDCSTDNTIEVVTPFLSEKIKLINLDINSGCVSIPRGIGIVDSHGEYIAPTDDDVINHPNKFKDLIAAMTDSDVLTYGNRLEYNTTSRTVTRWNPDSNWNPNARCGIDNGQLIYKSNVFDKVPLRFPTHECDRYMAIQIYPHGTFRYADVDVSTYIWHSNNRTLNRKSNCTPTNPAIYTRYFQEYNHSNINIDYSVYP